MDRVENQTWVQLAEQKASEKSESRISTFNMAAGDTRDIPLSSARPCPSTHKPPGQFNHLGALFGLVAWTNYLGGSSWESAIHQCETFESMPKVVHGIDCGARLAHFVVVTVLACIVSGYVFGAALSQP